MRIKRRFIAFIIAILLFLGYKYIDYTYFPLAPNNAEKISFIVKQGESIKSIAKNLEEKKIVQSNWAFYLYVRRKGLDENVQAGRFLLRRDMAVPQIAQTLNNGSKAEYIVTIPEGFTIKDIDKSLTSGGLIKEGEFINCANNNCYGESPEYLKGKSIEGFLFPDTYFVEKENFSVGQFIKRLLNTFDKKLTSALREDIKKQNRSIYETIIMASIIEKEVKTDKDRPLISDILWKRLNNGWFLGADATLLYGKDKNDISSTDLVENSLYNTRNHKGLSPTPISNPGIASIKAAIYPKSNPYWFYLTKPGSGEVVYAVTNDEHNENRAKYLQ